MNRDAAYLDHILECVTRIEGYIGDDPTRITSEPIVEDAVMRNLQIIAESTKRLSKELKERYQEIPWDQIKGLRNALVHDYLNVTHGVIVEILSDDLPVLKRVVQKMREDFDPNLFTSLG